MILCVWMRSSENVTLSTKMIKTLKNKTIGICHLNINIYCLTILGHVIIMKPSKQLFRPRKGYIYMKTSDNSEKGYQLNSFRRKTTNHTW